MFAFVTAASRWKERTSVILVDMMCVFVSLWLWTPLYIIIYSLCKVKGYSFDEKTSTLRRTQYFVRLNILFCCRPARSSPLVAFESKQWGDFYFLDASPLLGPGTSQRRFHNICFELDGMWCVSHHRLDEPWVPPGSNCPHHQSDCELTNSADPQLMEWLRQNGRARGDDGIIRYLCLLLCLVQRGVAHNSSSWYSVCHLLHYKGL